MSDQVIAAAARRLAEALAKMAYERNNAAGLEAQLEVKRCQYQLVQIVREESSAVVGGER
jgi:hypothetical protein